MDASYILMCGVVWQKTADPEAGWELVEGLESPDPRLRLLAQSLLIESGQGSMALLEIAVSGGIVSAEVAGPCMAEILRSEQAGQIRGQGSRQHSGDVFLC